MDGSFPSRHTRRRHDPLEAQIDGGMPILLVGVCGDIDEGSQVGHSYGATGPRQTCVRRRRGLCSAGETDPIC